jgi:diguanylate cyclase (GGDEF)-like protein
VQLVAEEVHNASEEHPVSLSLLDVDSFAPFDHEHGIEVGDALLVKLAQELTQRVGESVPVARYSRDTFLLLFLNKQADEAFLATEKIRASFDELPLDLALPTGGVFTAQITLSGGVASYPSAAVQNERELLRQANAALFRAKTGGRARTAFAQPERLEPKTVHFAPGQLRRLSELSHMTGRSEASLLREALDDLLAKYYSQRLSAAQRQG